MNKIRKKWNQIESKTTVVALILLLIFILITIGPQFFRLNNITNILIKASRNGGIIALGMTFVILAGEVDLSLGAIVALSGVVMGLVGRFNALLGILSGLLVGVISGIINGYIVTKMKISSWIASLAISFALRGTVLVISDESVKLEDSKLQFASKSIFESANFRGIPIIIIIFIIILLICEYISKHTKFGMRLYAVGGNQDAANKMGVNVGKTKRIAFLLSGLLASISGILLASSIGSASLSSGNNYETYAIAMNAIGGVQLSGGVGNFTGTFLGILIFFIINTIFTYIPGLSVHWQTVIMGLLVLLSVFIQSNYLHELIFRHENVKTIKG